jgi:hypothetical protein
MPDDADPQPQVAPYLTHVRMEWNQNYPNGFIHLLKKNTNNEDVTTVGYVRGTNLAKGYTVEVQRNAKKKYWKGTIIDGPNTNGSGQEYWSFRVANVTNEADPDQEDTLQVTVTNTEPTPLTSNPLKPDPVPAEIP